MHLASAVHARRFLVTWVALGLAVLTGASSAAGGASPDTYALPRALPSAQARPSLEMLALTLLNQVRREHELPLLVPHAGLRAAARAHGREMFAHGFFSHRSRDGRTPAQRVLDRGIRVRVVGENIAYAPDVVSAHAALMASESHRRNMLSPRYSLVGVAVLDGGPFGLIVVQDYADASAPPAASTGP
jgi:uncharacterized protein YkwD